MSPSQPPSQSAPLESDDCSEVSVSNGNPGQSEPSGRSSSGKGDTDFSSDATQHQELAARETKAVRNLRLIMLLVLLAMAVVAAALIYVFSRNSEKAGFQTEFESAGSKVLSGFQEDFLRKMQAMDSLSKSVTSFATNSNATWPFVTVPDTAELFQPYLDLTGAAALTVMPFVAPRDRANWESYVEQEQGWIDRALEQRSKMDSSFDYGAKEALEKTVPRFIHNYVGLDTTPGPWTVWHQYAPVISNKYFVNFNRQAITDFKFELEAIKRKNAVFSKASTYVPGLDFQSTLDFNFMNELLYAGGNGNYKAGEPIGYIYYPIFQDVDDETSDPVGVVMATVYWKSFFENILSDNIKGIVCVVQNTAGQQFTYKVSGRDATFLGMEDLHDSSYDKYQVTAEHQAFVEQATYHGLPLDDEHITYSIRVYPSSELEAEYKTNAPIVYSCCVFLVFLLAAATFLTYDIYVEKRQKILYNTAVKSTAVVSSLFPESVQKRLMSEVDASAEPKTRKEAFLNGKTVDTSFDPKSRPIADLFPEATIMFADMAGFTSWSSSRDPLQVFTLLETIYNGFDAVAKRRRVFKVETIGDCYVAVAGLPTPRKDHALVMVKFAQDCLVKMSKLCHSLETTLGPDTGDLNLRIGLHSGPVTAGVLRGDKGRFQLFGDTMNTASRMESTGLPGRIQISRSTRDYLVKAGKENWVTEREDEVLAKGLGKLQTYWVRRQAGSNVPSLDRESDEGLDSSELDNKQVVTSERTQRLVQWNVELLLKQLRVVVARRQSTSNKPSTIRRSTSKKAAAAAGEAKGGTVLDEVQDVIALPLFDASVYEKHVDPNTVTIPSNVCSLLQDFVGRIASMYRDNPFHSYEHASHVTMSVSKLLSRIVHPSMETNGNTPDKEIARDLHDHTFGLTSDPITHFASVLSALIHDVDHRGVTNMTLVNENDPLVVKYNGKSVAEQNSMELSWQVFMEPKYKDLRDFICPTPEELAHLRQILINVVMATDIADRELAQMRKDRWEKAFSSGGESCCVSSREGGNPEDINRKASIVLEHLIQASDVAHTMQHFTVFKKWNEKLFFEVYKAYLEGRTDQDPSKGWYRGEIGFFDYYVIPLAKKLETCGVFGVSSLEYLSCAELNRREWEEKGEQLVQEYLAKFNEQYKDVVQRHRKMEQLRKSKDLESGKHQDV